MEQHDVSLLDRADPSLARLPFGDHLGALAAAVETMEPDVRALASRVHVALRALLSSLSDASGDDDFEVVWISSGAAALYDATIEMADVLTTAVGQLEP